MRDIDTQISARGGQGHIGKTKMLNKRDRHVRDMDTRDTSAESERRSKRTL